MSKLKFEYNIRGYRYAPESFHIYKGLPGQKKKEIPLSDEQRQQMGYLCLTEGVKSAVDYVKHIERERERKCRQYMTYGFMLKENPHEYVYCPSLRCRESDTLKTRLCILQAVREELARDKGRVEQSVECDLDGHYRPVNIRKHYATADCALPGFVDSKNEEKTERNAGYLVVSHSGGGMLRQGTRKGIRRTPANRGMRAHRVVKGLDISEDVCHGMCP